jgi:heme exporter protein D
MEQWTSFGQWLAMGGYAAYVWPSIGLALGALVLNMVAARRRHAEAIRRALRRLAIDFNGEK